MGDDALLGERKGLNAPGVELPGLPVLTEYDRRVLEWAVAQDVHAVFASFVRRGEDVAKLKAFLEDSDQLSRCHSLDGERQNRTHRPTHQDRPEGRHPEQETGDHAQGS